MPGEKARCWCFTTNNPTGDDSTYVRLAGDVRYAVWQRETAPTTGTIHLQGYIQYTRALSMIAVCKLLKGASCRVALGNQASNREYCTKDKDRVSETSFYEIGTAMNPGTRTDLWQVKKDVDDGKNDKELFDLHFPTMLRYYKAIQYYRDLSQPKRKWITKVVVITGETGCGKSHYVDQHAGEDPYRHCNAKWFGRYAGEDHVIFDEFYGSRFAYSYLLMLLDRYPMRVENKGGEVNFKPRWIWMTSNAPAIEWYDKPWYPLERRISINYEVPPGMPREEWTAQLDVLVEELKNSE